MICFDVHELSVLFFKNSEKTNKWQTFALSRFLDWILELSPVNADGVFTSKQGEPHAAEHSVSAKEGLSLTRGEFLPSFQAEDTMSLYSFVQPNFIVRAALSCSFGRHHCTHVVQRKILETYGDAARLKVIDGENHLISKKRKQVVAETVAFFKSLF